jgi:citrate lyase subunit beta/citryl-CoA lyase
MPGSNARALEKARTLPADALIFDLEDAVAPEAKATARQQVVGTLLAGGYGKRERIVRVNALATPWGRDDLVAIAASGADAVLLPKVESGDMVRQAWAILSAHGAPERLAIWCMIETPRGVLRLEDIATAQTQVAALVLGTSDLAKELHATVRRERLALLPSLGLALLVGRAYDLAVLDGVHLDLDDEEGFLYACQQAADMGCDGKRPSSITKPSPLPMTFLRRRPATCSGHAASSQRMRKRPPEGKGWCWWRGGSSRTYMLRTPIASCSSPTPLPPWQRSPEA